MSLARQLFSVITGICSGAFFLVAFFLVIEMYLISPSIFANETSHIIGLNSKEEKSLAFPHKIEFPSGLEVLLTEAKLLGGEWEVNNYSASYLLPTGFGGDDEGFIIYGHNWPTLLGELKKVKIGERIKIIDSNYQVIEYTVTYKTNVFPNDVQILDLIKPQSVLLYTCSGWLDSERLVVFASKNVGKN